MTDRRTFLLLIGFTGLRIVEVPITNRPHLLDTRHPERTEKRG